ncbi:MAG: PQQ-dependent sugar dehydrogenase [Anaerolineae bacterium]
MMGLSRYLWRSKTGRLLWLPWLTLVQWSCGPAAAVPTVAPTAVPIPATPIPTLPPQPPTATAVMAAQLFAPATVTPKPTSTASPSSTPSATIPPSATSLPPTETATSPPTATPAPATSLPVADAPTAAAPPPSGVVEPPPYAPSACSDKYPCNDDRAGWERRLRVPAGYQATYFARVDDHPTSITFGPDGALYVAAQSGTIYKVTPEGNVAVYVGGFNTPTGIAFQPGTSNLYVSSRARNENVGGESQISVVQGGGIRQIIGGLPCCYVFMHAANGIAFGPDGFGYVGVGARADHGEILDGSNRQDELHPLEAAILRFSPDGSLVEVYARGFRNPYDIAWDGSGQLYATDNAPDFGPPDELHRVAPGGQHGYPWYECDVCFAPPAEVQLIPPVYNFIPHAAVAGITAYLADQFPGAYNNLFVALWSAFPGAQKVMRMGPGGTWGINFATGFAAPIDVAVGPAGSLYVADWATGIIFKISYTG